MTGRRVWWTRERIAAGLRRFYEDFGVAPTYDRWYEELAEFTGVVRGGRSSTKGWEQKYPSYATIARHFRGMREAWAAAGVETDRGDMPWREEEDWFVVESVGLLERAEVARVLGRTVPAVKRRLYDLGVNTYRNRLGWTLARAAKALGVPRSTLDGYVRRGELSHTRGHKCCYVEPSELLAVREYDWARTTHPEEVEAAVRRGLAERLCRVLLTAARRAEASGRTSGKLLDFRHSHNVR